jgi:DNA-binding NarL/FixJ family response regulator
MPEPTTDAAERPIRVLVVDDDPAFRLITRTVLKRADGIEVVAEGEDGEQGLALAREHEPDVVLLDLLMPNRDGFDTLPELCRLLPDARVVVLTALDEREANREAALVGASGFLEKRHVVQYLVPLVRGESLSAVNGATSTPGVDDGSSSG